MDNKVMNKIILEDHQLIMQLAHIVVINQDALGGTSKLASDLAKCHQFDIKHLHN